MARKPGQVNIMRRFQLNEISAVKAGAQTDARCLLLKRADYDPDKSRVVPPSADNIEKLTGRIDKLTDVLTSRTDETEEDEMSKELQKQIDDLKADNQHLTQIAGLSGAEKSHYDGLDETAKADFLSMSADARSTIVKAAADENAVVYTTRDGDQIRKSDGATVLSLAKALDAERERNDTLQKARDQEKLEKRAREDLPNITGSLAVRAAALKAFDGIEDEEVRKGCHAILKAANDAQDWLNKARGVSGQPEPGSPVDEMEKMVTDYMEKHTVSRAEATAKLAETETYKSLYARSVRGDDPAPVQH